MAFQRFHKPLHALVPGLMAGAFLLTASGAASAAGYPDRPVSLIVSAAPGGTTDIAARLIAQPLGQALGQSVVVENRPGGSGGIAAQAVARAKPDGYTLLLQYSGFQVITPSVMKNIGWDPIKDFAPVANVLSAPQVIVVRPALPIHSLKELVSYAKANPGKLNYASSGNGSLQQVATELLNQQAGIQTAHIPYKGTGPALNDLLGGAVDMTITTPPPLLGQIHAGKLRALAVTGESRLPSLPDVPTTTQAGYPDLQVSSWFAMYAPAGTPPEVVNRLAGEIEKIMKSDAFRQKAAEQGAEARFMGPKELGDYTREELARWSKVVKAANITAE
ncbi:putattive exported protein [Bordetella ansorpii]|uniref:Putattive exported protein n=2 Tax=Bordetella ansorpii TaxID=288768 RepID=A0A157SI64_9BORD|nr:putattive exported protein [Bordetella ansorpii]